MVAGRVQTALEMLAAYLRLILRFWITAAPFTSKRSNRKLALSKWTSGRPSSAGSYNGDRQSPGLESARRGNSADPELRGMDRKTPHSITSPQKFLRETERVRNYGFAIDDEENADGQASSCI